MWFYYIFFGVQKSEKIDHKKHVTYNDLRGWTD